MTGGLGFRTCVCHEHTHLQRRLQREATVVGLCSTMPVVLALCGHVAHVCGQFAHLAAASTARVAMPQALCKTGPSMTRLHQLLCFAWHVCERLVLAAAGPTMGQTTSCGHQGLRFTPAWPSVVLWLLQTLGCAPSLVPASEHVCSSLALCAAVLWSIPTRVWHEAGCHFGFTGKFWLQALALVRGAMDIFKGSNFAQTGFFLMALSRHFRLINWMVVGGVLPFLWLQEELGFSELVTDANRTDLELKQWVITYCRFMACVVWTYAYGVQDKAANVWGQKLTNMGQSAYKLLRENAPTANVPKPPSSGAPMLDQAALKLLQIKITG